jgi:hexosaminidase
VTLWQLASATPAGRESPGAAPELPAGTVRDQPRFRWRGLMLDSARHYQSVEEITRLLDWMALHKLNVFHWHLTDDQGWRLQIRRYPRLTSVGAWRTEGSDSHRYGGFYTRAQVARVVAHARERNITVVPEIDLPGHTTAAIIAYPQLGVAGQLPHEVPTTWGVFRNLVNADPATFAFFQGVLDEVMEMFPGTYVHLGGDEAVKDQWKASPEVQQRLHQLGLRDEEALQGYFLQQMEQHLRRHGRHVIAWDEILAGGVSRDATIMSWRGERGAILAANAGNDTIQTPYPLLYFNCSALGKDAGVPGVTAPLRNVYDFEPISAAVSADQASHVIGVEGTLWTEWISTEARLEYLLFPRTAALAEVAWSDRSQRSWDGFQQRLSSQYRRYRLLGIGAADPGLMPDFSRK